MIEHPVCNYKNQQRCTWYIHTDKQIIKITVSITGKVLGKFCGLLLDFQGGRGKGKSQ